MYEKQHSAAKSRIGKKKKKEILATVARPVDSDKNGSIRMVNYTKCLDTV